MFSGNSSLCRLLQSGLVSCCLCGARWRFLQHFIDKVRILFVWHHSLSAAFLTLFPVVCESCVFPQRRFPEKPQYEQSAGSHRHLPWAIGEQELRRCPAPGHAQPQSFRRRPADLSPPREEGGASDGEEAGSNEELQRTPASFDSAAAESEPEEELRRFSTDLPPPWEEEWIWCPGTRRLTLRRNGFYFPVAY